MLLRCKAWCWQDERFRTTEDKRRLRRKPWKPKNIHEPPIRNQRLIKPCDSEPQRKKTEWPMQFSWHCCSYKVASLEIRICEIVSKPIKNEYSPHKPGTYNWDTRKEIIINCTSQGKQKDHVWANHQWEWVNHLSNLLMQKMLN